MDSNMIIILIGGIIVIVTLIILLKSGNRTEEDFNPEIFPQETLNHLAIMEGIEALKREVANIQGEIEELKELLEDHTHLESAATTVTTATAAISEWENFDQSLNYNMFVQKNSDILKLHREGKSPDEIAKRLNKSVREVEMVIKLIR